jgi:hypothetical protein
MNKTEKLINEKWNAIAIASKTFGEVRSDLFDNVALALSRIEGKLVFLNSDDTLDGKPRISDEFSQGVSKDLQTEVNQTRKELDKIFVKLTEGRDSLSN